VDVESTGAHSFDILCYDEPSVSLADMTSTRGLQTDWRLNLHGSHAVRALTAQVFQGLSIFNIPLQLL